MAGKIDFISQRYDDMSDITTLAYEKAAVQGVTMPKHVRYYPHMRSICYTSNAVRDVILSAAKDLGVQVERFR